MRKSLWSPDEDAKLKTYVAQHGYGNWSDVAKHAGLQRCGKSCRLRWLNYLRPDLKRGKFCADEIRLIVKLHKTLGNSWSKIASYLPGRTDNDVKNFWHSYTRSTRRVSEQLSTKFNTNVIDNGVGSNHDQLILGSSSCSHDSTSINSSTNDSTTHCDYNAMVMNPPTHDQSMMIHHENIQPLCENIIALGTNQIPHLLDVCSKEESRSSSTNVPTNHSFNQGLNYYHNLINGVNQQHNHPNYPLWDHQLVPTSSSDDGLQSVLWNFMNHQLHTSTLE